MTSANGQVYEGHERCVNCRKVLPMRLMMYLRHLWFCSGQCYNTYFNVSAFKPPHNKEQ